MSGRTVLLMILTWQIELYGQHNHGKRRGLSEKNISGSGNSIEEYHLPQGSATGDLYTSIHITQVVIVELWTRMLATIQRKRATLYSESRGDRDFGISSNLQWVLIAANIREPGFRRESAEA